MHSGSDSAKAKSYSSRGPGSGSTTLILGTGNDDHCIVSYQKINGSCDCLSLSIIPSSLRIANKYKKQVRRTRSLAKTYSIQVVFGT